MSLDEWSGRNALLNEFRAAIQRRTHGRLSHLSLDVIDGALVLEAHSATYYAVQLALATIKAFTADFPKVIPAKMSFRVNGHPLVLRNAHARGKEEAADSDLPFESNKSILVDRPEQQSHSSLMSTAVATAAT